MGQARDEAGNVWETDAQGNAVRLISAAGQPQGGVYTLPPDPVEQARIANEQARVGIAQNADARAQGMQGLREELLRAQIAKAEADAAKASQGTAGAAAGDAKQQARIANINSLVEQINRVQELFEQGPGATSGIQGLQDFFPSAVNRQFDTAAAGLAEQGLAAFRVPGVGAQSDTELRQFVQANRPEASDYDATVEEKLTQLRNRVDNTRQAMGLPPAEWTGQLPNALTVARQVSGGQREAAGQNATTQSEPVAPGYQQAYEAFVRSGNWTPDQYAAYRKALDEQFYGEALDQTDTYRAEGERIRQTLDKGGSLNLDLSAETPMTTGAFSDQARNNAVNNPVGAALAGLTDMAGFGGVSYLAPEQMAALNEAQPGGMAVGQVGGAITGTGALGALGRNTVGRALPGLLRGAGEAQFARNLATDAAYGGIYGGVTDGDPLAGAGWAMLGSGLGQGAGTVLGRGVSGVTSSPTIARLYEQGVIPTIGQIMRGRAVDNGGRSFVAGVEDVIANNGAVGTLVNSARNRALEQGNLAAFNIASQGKPITAIGEQGLDQLDTVVDDAYANALNGVSMPITDTGFVQGVANASRRGEAVDAARGRGDFTYVMDNELAPILNTPDISGQQFQDALRLLRGQSRAYSRAATGVAPDPAAQGVSSALDEVAGALTDLAGNYSPDTVPQLNQANSMYRNLLVLDDAAQRGVSEGGTFTPAQLGAAIKANNSALGRRGLRASGDSPFFELQQDMQAVLPNKVPPTGVNAAPILALAGAASGAGGYATDNEALKYASLLGLLAAPYTKTGQRAAAAALLSRGPRAQMIGTAIRNKSGLLGSAMLPALLAN